MNPVRQSNFTWACLDSAGLSLAIHPFSSSLISFKGRIGSDLVGLCRPCALDFLPKARSLKLATSAFGLRSSAFSFRNFRFCLGRPCQRSSRMPCLRPPAPFYSLLRLPRRGATKAGFPVSALVAPKRSGGFPLSAASSRQFLYYTKCPACQPPPNEQTSSLEAGFQRHYALVKDQLARGKWLPTSY
jgi:hypothetical protein